jgi:hypothetical protein
MTNAIRFGFRVLYRNWGLAVLLLVLNLLFARTLSGPLGEILERELRHKGASVTMMYGFDYDWWARWSESQKGWTAAFAPDILGKGFVAKNLEQMLRGALPVRLFATEREPQATDDPQLDRPVTLDPVILGLGGLYWLLQLFLTGGLIGVFRAPEGGWTIRGLAHGSGFYFGRILRIALLALLSAGLVFLLNRPLASWAEGRARETVSETGALGWLFGRYALLFMALLFVNMVSSFAKVAVVLEERSSALLAFLTSLGFTLRHLASVAGLYLVPGLLSALLLAVWAAVDSRFPPVGYRSQLLTLALFELFVLGRIALRLSLMGSQVSFYRERAARS